VKTRILFGLLSFNLVLGGASAQADSPIYILKTTAGESVQVSADEIKKVFKAPPQFHAKVTRGNDGRAILRWPRIYTAGVWKYIHTNTSADLICRQYNYERSIGSASVGTGLVISGTSGTQTLADVYENSQTHELRVYIESASSIYEEVSCE
jgi:hypothetical protein